MIENSEMSEVGFVVLFCGLAFVLAWGQMKVIEWRQKEISENMKKKEKESCRDSI